MEVLWDGLSAVPVSYMWENGQRHVAAVFKIKVLFCAPSRRTGS